jgi:transcriptional regulator MraZ
MFPFGNSPTRMDEKGRLKLPADLKRVADDVYGPKFFVTSRDGKRAEIYPEKEWEAYTEKLKSVPNSNASKQKLMKALSYYGAPAELDAQGRLLISQHMREKLNLNGDVYIFGMQTYLEVANRQDVDAAMETDPMNVDDQKELEKFGL